MEKKIIKFYSKPGTNKFDAEEFMSNNMVIGGIIGGVISPMIYLKGNRHHTEFPSFMFSIIGGCIGGVICSVAIVPLTPIIVIFYPIYYVCDRALNLLD